MGTAEVWAGLTLDERALLLRLAMPSMRQAPRLLRLRHAARTADLRNREIVGPRARHIEYLRWLVAQGRIGDGV